MDVSSKTIVSPRRWALIVYLTLTSLMFLGILTQGFLIGALLFAGAGWAGDAHTIGGLVVLILALLLPLAGLLARIPGRLMILSIVLFLLTLLQGILPNLSGSIPFLAALHPTNAMLLFGGILLLIMQGWRLTPRNQRSAGIMPMQRWRGHAREQKITIG